MVPEIWSATDRIFCHFGPLYALLPHSQESGDIIILHVYTINDNHMIYGS